MSKDRVQGATKMTYTTFRLSSLLFVVVLVVWGCSTESPVPAPALELPKKVEADGPKGPDGVLRASETSVFSLPLPKDTYSTSTGRGAGLYETQQSYEDLIAFYLKNVGADYDIKRSGSMVVLTPKNKSEPTVRIMKGAKSTGPIVMYTGGGARKAPEVNDGRPLFSVENRVDYGKEDTLAAPTAGSAGGQKAGHYQKTVVEKDGKKVVVLTRPDKKKKGKSNLKHYDGIPDRQSDPSRPSAGMTRLRRSGLD